MYCVIYFFQIPLGVLLKDENKLDEMVDIMSHLHQYIPAQEFTEDVALPNTGGTVPVQKAVMHSILFGGDQLTAA